MKRASELAETFELPAPKRPNLGIDRLHVLILNEFLRLGRAPTRVELAQTLGFSANELDCALNQLEGDDILVLSRDGEIAAAYPYSGIETVHSVEVEGKKLFANCAIDALGVPFMVGRNAAITSECASCGAPIRIAIKGSEIDSSQPPGIQVWYVRKPQRCGPSISCQCPAINFFCNEGHLEKWRTEHFDSVGKPLTLEEAADLGKRYFGNSIGDNQKRITG